MGLRLFRMATGAVPPLAEAQRMIPEKVSALNDARALVAKGGLSDRTAGKVVALYRGRVKADEIGFRRALASRSTDGPAALRWNRCP